MKRCEKCNKTYADNNLNYCLDDGTTLVFEGEEQTVIAQKPPLPQKKGKSLLLFGIIGLLIFGGIGIVGAYLLYNKFASDKNTDKVDIKIPTSSNSPKTSTTPKATATPKATPTTDANSTPKTEESSETSEEITPIAWTTNTMQFAGEVGQTYKFECPPNGIAGGLWGSDIYTGDSSICTAAVHFGLFSLEQGGIVTVEYRPGRKTYGSTERNGITSNTFGEYERSFVVR